MAPTFQCNGADLLRTGQEGRKIKFQELQGSEENRWNMVPYRCQQTTGGSPGKQGEKRGLDRQAGQSPEQVISRDAGKLEYWQHGAEQPGCGSGQKLIPRKID